MSELEVKDGQQAEDFIAALARYFDCEPEKIGAFAMTVEVRKEDDVMLSSAWSSDAAVWTLSGMARELVNHIESSKTR